MKYHNTTICEDVVKSQVTERITIKLKAGDENEAAKVIDAARSSGSTAAIIGYALSDPDKAVDEARKKALEDAGSKAKDYAASFGFELGRSMEIEEVAYPDIEIGPSYDHGWNMPMPIMPMRMSGWFWRGVFPHMDGYLPGEIHSRRHGRGHCLCGRDL